MSKILYFAAVIFFYFFSTRTLLPDRAVFSPHQKYIRGWVLDLARKTDSDISLTPPLHFAGVKCLEYGGWKEAQKIANMGTRGGTYSNGDLWLSCTISTLTGCNAINILSYLIVMLSPERVHASLWHQTKKKMWLLQQRWSDRHHHDDHRHVICSKVTSAWNIMSSHYRRYYSKSSPVAEMARAALHKSNTQQLGVGEVSGKLG